MGTIKRVGDLEIVEDLGLQHRLWRVRRIAWIVMVLVVLAALLGLFGPGLLSNVTARPRGGPLWLEYHRFERSLAPVTLRVHLGAGAGQAGKARIWLDRHYMEGMQVEHISPPPQSVETGNDRLIYVFQIADPGQATAISFHLTAQRIGLQSGRLGLSNGPPIVFSQFIYP